MNIGYINEFKRAERHKKLEQRAAKIDAVIVYVSLFLIFAYSVATYFGVIK